MRNLRLLALVLAAGSAFADPILKNAGTTIGPVLSLDATTDGGLFFSRATGSSTANMYCAFATGNTPGCVSTGAQTFSGPKVFNDGAFLDGGAFVTATTAATALYVDPLGSDSNTCASLLAPCLTYPGVLDKLPNVIRSTVTITGAAGAFDGGVVVSGFLTDYSAGTAPSITVQGALANVTPTTGSATGTCTSATAGSGVTFGTMVDSAALWTTNDFAGRFLVITGGTGVGTVKMIQSNTGTTITVDGQFATVPVAGSTYAIQSSTVHMTGALTAFFVTGNTVPITFKNIDCANSAGACVSVINNPGNVTAQQMTTTGFTTSTPFAVSSKASLSVQNSSIVTTSGIGASGSGDGVTLSVLSSRIVNAAVSDSVRGVLFSGTGTGIVSGTSIFSGRGVDVRGGVVSVSSVRVDCNSVVTSIAMLAGLGSGSADILVGPIDIANCDFAAFAQGKGFDITGGTYSGSVTGAGDTAIFRAVHGGAIFVSGMSSQAITTSGVWADADYSPATKTDPYTNGADSACITNHGGGAMVCSQ